MLKNLDRSLQETGEALLLIKEGEQLIYRELNRWLTKKYQELKRKLFPPPPPRNPWLDI